MHKFKLRRIGVADDPGAWRPSLQGCLDAVLDHSEALMGSVLSGLNDSLGAQGDKKAIAIADPAARGAIEALNQQAKVIGQVYSADLRSRVFGGDVQNTSHQPLVRFEDFQFLEPGEIDASIEFAMAQQEVARAVDDVLPPLNGLVSTLMGWTSVQAHLNPLRAENFVLALQHTLQEFVPDAAVRGKLMPFAAGRLGVNLRQLYQEVTQWLRSQGVEPVFVPVQAGGTLANPARPTEGPVARTMLTLEKLRRLLAGELSPAPQADGKTDFGHTIPASMEALQDLRLVESMVKRLTDRANGPGAASAEPAAGVEPEQRRRMGAQLGEEVVRLMLENLMKDRRLLPQVREQLKALEPVLLRLTSADARFFSDRQHPARLFLEAVTHRSLAFASEDASGLPRFLKSVANGVQVLHAGAGDAAEFARVLRKLEDGWTRDEGGRRARAEEAAKTLLHAEQRNLLAQRVSADLLERLQGAQVPEFVRQFLRGPWAQVMAEARLKLADGTVDPGGYVGLVDDLLWSVQPRLARRNRPRLVQMVPGMLVKMRRGLALIDFPDDRMSEFFDALVTLHEQAFDSGKGTGTGSGAEAPASGTGTMPAQPGDLWVADNEAQESGYFDDVDSVISSFSFEEDESPHMDASDWAVDDLRTGCWVNLAVGTSWVRAQLTWVSPQRTLFLFNAESGLTHSMSRRSLDRFKASGLLQLVSDGRVMDDALDAVAQAALLNDLNTQKR